MTPGPGDLRSLTALVPTLCLGLMLAGGCRDSTQPQVMAQLEDGREFLLASGRTAVDQGCLEQRLPAIVKAYEAGRLLRIRVMLHPEHELVRGIQIAQRVETMAAGGTRLLVPLRDNRVFSRDADDEWALWELPPELGLGPCIGGDD